MIARDYVTEGIARLPQLGQQPKVVKYLTVYLEQIAQNETVTLQVLDGFLNWRSGETRSWILDTIGGFIGQPRPTDFNDDDYRFILGARAIARVSDSSLADVQILVAYLARETGYLIDTSVPEHWYVTFIDMPLTAQWSALYATILLDAIGATDSLELTAANGGTALYDVDDGGGYDFSTYG
jgi:hypothetical protein